MADIFSNLPFGVAHFEKRIKGILYGLFSNPYEILSWGKGHFTP